MTNLREQAEGVADVIVQRKKRLKHPVDADDLVLAYRMGFDAAVPALTSAIVELLHKAVNDE